MNHLIDSEYKVFLKMKDTSTVEITKWLNEYIGEIGKDWDCYYASDNPENYDLYFIFNTAEDASWFTLRWL